MKLLFYELSKFCSKKKVLLAVLLFLILNLTVFYYQNQQIYTFDHARRPYIDEVAAQTQDLPLEEAMTYLENLSHNLDMLSAYFRFKDQAEDPTLAEMLDLWMKDNAELLDQYAGTRYLEDLEYTSSMSAAARSYLEQLTYIKNYPDFIHSIRANAERMLKFPIFSSEGTFAYNNILKTPEAFESLETLPLAPGPSLGIVQSSSYRLTDIFLLGALFLLGLYLFLHEEDTGLIRLVRTTKNGRGATIAAKLGAAGLISLLLSLVFHGSVFLLGCQMFSAGDLSRPIQSLPDFQNCTLAVSVGQYIGLFLLFKMGVSLLSTWIISLIFLLFKNIKSIFVILAGFFGISALFYFLIPATSWLSLLKYINIFSFLDSYELLRRYANLNFFSLAWNRLTVTLITTGILLLFIPALAVLGYLKNYSFNFMDRLLQRISALWQRLTHKRPLRGQTNVFCHELRKILITGRAWIFLVLALFLCLRTIKPDKLIFHDASTVTYYDYAMKWAGPVTSEKSAAIERERDRINAFLDLMQLVHEQYEAGTLDLLSYQMQYSSYNSQYTILSAAFERLYNPYLASLEMEKETGYTAAIVDDISVEFMFNNPLRDQQKGFLFLLLILLSLSAVFPMDEERGISAILRCTVKGRKRRLTSQLICSGLIVLFLWLCLYTPLITELLVNYNLTFEVPIQNIAAYRDFSLPLTIGEFLLLKAFGSFLAGLCAAVCVLLLSHLTSKQGFCILLAGVLLLFPFLALFLGISALNGFSLVNALAPFQVPGSLQVHSLIYLGLILLITVAGTLLLYKKK